METCSIATSDRHPVVADLYPGADPAGAGLVVLCHGFKGHRRWGFIPALAARLAGAGVTALAMDFSLNGHVTPDGGGGGAFAAPELFRLNTIARERDDLAAALAWARRGRGEGPGSMGVWGHSRGGVAAILAALDDPGARARVGAVVTWSTAAHPDFYTDHQKERWRRDGGYAFTDAATGTRLALGIGYLDDIEAHAAEYDLAARVGMLEAAHLIVHGEHDLVIPPAEAERLLAGPAGGPDRRRDKRLLRLATGHTFGYEGEPAGDALERAIAATVEWFTRYLARVNERGIE